MRKVNLTKIDGTIGKVFVDNRDELLNKTADKYALIDKIKILFASHKINTPKSREIIYKLNEMNSFASALMYVQNIIFRAAGMGV